jgi:uncharacterized protein (DUF1015 family)
MAEVQPLRALHYELERTGGLQPVVAPPYDVIDEVERAMLERRSPYNVVRIDLPRVPVTGADQYQAAAETLQRWRDERVVVQDDEPAIWALSQDYTAPDGRERTRRGFLARVRVEAYGAGRIRPHERTHPGPREDRLRLTRATRANLSPIFSLFDDPGNVAWNALGPFTERQEWGHSQDPDGTVNRLWRIGDPQAITEVQGAIASTELLIADGHHRYETARVYAEEIGGEGPHRYVLMCLVALQDPGLTVFPTHRLVRELSGTQWERLAQSLRDSFELEELSRADALSDGGNLAATADGRVRIGYIDRQERRPLRLTLRDQEIADRLLPDHAEPYRRLDTAILEAIVLKGALEMSDEDIDHLHGLGYARDDRQPLEAVQRGEYDAAFFMAPTPVQRVQEVAAAGESMPPKSTYFFPKVPTGLLFNPLT